MLVLFVFEKLFAICKKCNDSLSCMIVIMNHCINCIYNLFLNTFMVALYFKVCVRAFLQCTYLSAV